MMIYTMEDLHLASRAGMPDITGDDPLYDDLNPECVRYGTD